MIGWLVERNLFRSILRIDSGKTALNLKAIDPSGSYEPALNQSTSHLRGGDSPLLRQLFESSDIASNTESIYVSKKALVDSLFENSEVIYWKPFSEDGGLQTSQLEYSFSSGTLEDTAQVRQAKAYIDGRKVPESGSAGAGQQRNGVTVVVDGQNVVFTFDYPPGISGSPSLVEFEWHTKVIEVEV